MCDFGTNPMDRNMERFLGHFISYDNVPKLCNKPDDLPGKKRGDEETCIRDLAEFEEVHDMF